MATGSVLVSVSDEDTLNLCLERGVYGQHVTVQDCDPRRYGNYYWTLADFGTVREGTHVFFSLGERLYYGGQAVGADDHGAFYVDGTSDSLLIRFEDGEGMAGNYVDSHQFYFELGEYPYLLPSHRPPGKNFRPLTPGETQTLLTLLGNDWDGCIDVSSHESTELADEVVTYSPKYEIRSPEEAHSELHLEASVVSNPSLLPRRLRPNDATVCRQVPISPYKPTDVVRADVAYYSETDPIEDGTLPNAILELETDAVGSGVARRIRKYLLWLHRYLGDEAERIDAFVYAPHDTPDFWNEIPDAYESQVEVVTFGGI